MSGSDHHPSGVVRLRAAVTADAPALAALARKTFSDTFRGTCTDADLAAFLDEYYTADLFRRDLESPNVHLWLACEDDAPVGYLQATPSPVPFPHTPGKTLELQRLYVLQEGHGKGIAAALMQQFFRLAADAGASLVWLGVWEHNLRAQAFYRKWGFAPTGHTHPFPIGSTPQTDEWWSRPV